MIRLVVGDQDLSARYQQSTHFVPGIAKSLAKSYRVSDAAFSVTRRHARSQKTG